METNKNNRKIVIFGVILLIIAGIIVVALKGFNVSLMFGKHEAIELKIGKEVDLNVVKEICREVFEKKEFVAKELEVFGDSVQINVKTITDEEKSKLVNQINDKFETSKTVEDLNINSISNKRMRDVIRPYLASIAISFVVIFIYIFIRFRKINAVKIILEFIKNSILIEAILLSIIAVTRLEVTDLLINLLVIVPIAQLVYVIVIGEKKLEIENN